MVNKLNKFLTSSIIISIMMFIIGLIFIVYPEVSLKQSHIFYLSY